MAISNNTSSRQTERAPGLKGNIPPRPNSSWLHMDLLHGMANIAEGSKILLDIDHVLAADGLLKAAQIF
jgi:hypothetical protein